MSSPPPQSPLASPEPWDLVSAAYAAEALPFFEVFAKRALALAEVPPGARVLDVATGPGTLALMAAETAQVTALDFSPAMVVELERRARAAGITLDVHTGNGQALPFSANQFDRAFSMFGLIFFPDRGAGFRELLRVLVPGGRAVVSSWAPFTGPFADVMESLRTHLPGLPFGQGAAPLGDEPSFAAELAAAGFVDVAVHAVTHPEPFPSMDEFWQSLQRTTAPIVLLRRRMGEPAWGALAAAVKADLVAKYGNDPGTAPMTALLGTGRKPDR
jgi:SAM-dependent methyltransferase